MVKNEIYTELSTLWSAFDAAHNGTKKKNAGEARKALGAIKKLVTSYNKASVEEGKSSK